MLNRITPTVLLTGFEPFGGDDVNPSWEAVTALEAAAPPGVRLVTARLPMDYARIDHALVAALDRHRPDVLIATGQAARAEMSVERVAINIDDARIPDNAGARPIDMPVAPGGPVGYFATLPIKAMVAAMRAAGVPAQVSQTAGTFGCNHVFYLARHLAETAHPGLRAGFIHVPCLPAQAAQRPGTPSMALATIVAGLRAAVEAVRDTVSDLRVSEGAEH
jgi:pyroglutamyl-peptidase